MHWSARLIWWWFASTTKYRLHRGALLADGFVSGKNLMCGVHYWDYRLDSGVSEYANGEALAKFDTWIESGEVLVDADEIAAWAQKNPQPFNRKAYLGLYADTSHGTDEEPHNQLIRQYARDGLSKVGHHGKVEAMGVPREELPKWDDIQILTAQLHKMPLLDHEVVGTDIVIGPKAARPLRLEIPLFVSDMSFGALSEPAKVSLARGAELAGTGICSGEGGMLPEEQAENSRYFYELASARFGFGWDNVAKVQAFHFKGGQGAKTGTGGHLPGKKVKGRIAEVRGLEPGQDAISPSRFPEWSEPSQIKEFADEVRQRTGGIPIGYKLSAQHIEKDIDAALEVGVDYIILDGRGGGTGAAPIIFRDIYLGSDDPGAGPRPAPSGRIRPPRCHPDHHWRPAQTGRFRQGNGIGCGCRGIVQRRDAGHRLHRHVRLPHEQLPGRHRHTKTASCQPVDSRKIRPKAHKLFRRQCRIDASDGPGLRP